MRVIAHLDMDAFFAAVEERERPRLKGKPIVVGSDPQDGKGRGVVSTANYKAREYGIHSAMPITKAWELSEKAKKEGKPEAIFIEPSDHLYSDISKEILEIVSRTIEKVYPSEFSNNNLERASIDEAFLDLSFTGSFKRAEILAKKIQREIKSKENLTCSIGIGPNKLIAKIASDFKKPDGLTIVSENKVADFLNPMPIRKIPGIGPKTEILLKNLGIKTISDLKQFSNEKLEKLLGKWGASLYKKARGEDASPVGEDKEVHPHIKQGTGSLFSTGPIIPRYSVGVKSIGEQETFPQDTLDPNLILERLRNLSASVFRSFAAKGGFSPARLASQSEAGRSGRKSYKTITITVRFSDFETKNRSHTLKSGAEDLSTLEFEAMKLISPFFDARENPKKKRIRLIGVRIEKME